MFGSPETTPGGLALKFYATVRLDVRRIAAIKRGEEVIGSRTRVRVVKNKVAPPFRQAEFDIIYGKGISRAGELVDMGVEHNLVVKSGSWFALGDKRIGQGREAAIDFLNENEKDAKKLEAMLREKLAVAPPRAAPAADEDNGDSAAKKK